MQKNTFFNANEQCLQSFLTNVRVWLFVTFHFCLLIEKQELWPALQIAVATLSMGPVGPSDMIGATNKDLLMRYQYIISGVHIDFNIS
jgi:hypothetical protein